MGTTASLPAAAGHAAADFDCLRSRFVFTFEANPADQG